MDMNSRAMKILMMSHSRSGINPFKGKKKETESPEQSHGKQHSPNQSIDDISINDLVPDMSFNMTDISMCSPSSFERIEMHQNTIPGSFEAEDEPPVYTELVSCLNRSRQLTSTPRTDSNTITDHGSVTDKWVHDHVMTSSTPAVHNDYRLHNPLASSGGDYDNSMNNDTAVENCSADHQPTTNTNIASTLNSPGSCHIETQSHDSNISNCNEQPSEGAAADQSLLLPNDHQNQTDTTNDTEPIQSMKCSNLGKGLMKRKRELGEQYIGRKVNKQSNTYTPVEKNAKSLDERCNCKAKYHRCKEISDKCREDIHKYVWSLTWDEKRVFVKTSVDALDVKERKTTTDNSRRQSSLYYSLKKDQGTSVRVCKQMFIATTGLTQWFILSCMKEDDSNDKTPLAEIDDNVQQTSQPSDKLKVLKTFLEELPKMPSHYCRKDTSKLYVEPNFQNYADLYEEYKKFVSTKDIDAMGRTSFRKEVKKMKISIYKPRKDKCDGCCAYETGNINEEEHQIHLKRKDEAQKEKEKDKNDATINDKVKAITVDVQRVLLAPSLNASALYYKTKLQVHNYSIFDLVSKDTLCYLWHEAEGGMTSNEFSSCLVDYLQDNNGFDRYIVFSDGCTYQNRNHVLSSALRYFCTKNGKIVEQKFLERGHTQMEVDSVHAKIETKLKGKAIQTPSDYVQIIKEARKNPKPYRVKYLEHDFFKNYKMFGNLKSIKPGKKASDPNVTNIKAIRYNPDGAIHYKLSFADEWIALPLPRNDEIPTIEPNQLYTSRLKIKQTKFDHLQAMKAVMLKGAHAFYDALPH